VADGDKVRVVSRYGSADISVRVSAGLRPGELFATFHTSATFLNAVTSGRSDPTTGTPEYKVTAVTIEKV
jgi:predicted molibdopterin-dependent oxidoreductase YjgC